eukprot:TRINITY_DN18168_c0_g1_i1.p1 TRINITY_DN18168_c0_g1~~TRINITY_DN18168_c0_g1_i1.p1  ORF type:complete len:835 (+),score=149.08 TRINITY_DN18168_c0_g1_i1:42-2546(+)
MQLSRGRPVGGRASCRTAMPPQDGGDRGPLHAAGAAGEQGADGAQAGGKGEAAARAQGAESPPQTAASDAGAAAQQEAPPSPHAAPSLGGSAPSAAGAAGSPPPQEPAEAAGAAERKGSPPPLLPAAGMPPSPVGEQPAAAGSPAPPAAEPPADGAPGPEPGDPAARAGTPSVDVGALPLPPLLELSPQGLAGELDADLDDTDSADDSSSSSSSGDPSEQPESPGAPSESREPPRAPSVSPRGSAQRERPADPGIFDCGVDDSPRESARRKRSSAAAPAAATSRKSAGLILWEKKGREPAPGQRPVPATAPQRLPLAAARPGKGAAQALEAIQPPRLRDPPNSTEMGDGIEYIGTLKSFSADDGYGFIKCPELYARFGWDVWVHWRQLSEDCVVPGAVLAFMYCFGKNHRPQARRVRRSSPQPPAGLQGTGHGCPQPPDIIQVRTPSCGRTATSQGVVVGDYKLHELLGEGNFAIVRAATHRDWGRCGVAIKCITKEDPESGAARDPEQVLWKVALQAAVSHTNVVSMYEVMESSAAWFLACELADGGTLKNRILTAPGRRLGDVEARGFFGDLTAALHACHGRGIAHCSVCPESCLISPYGVLKLSEFGAARWQGGGTQEVWVEGTVGAPRYRAPEALTAGRYNAVLADCWSVGCVFYEALAGAGLYAYGAPGDSVEEAEAALAAGRINPSPSHFGGDAKDAISGLLCFKPLQRLRMFEAHQRPFATPPSTPNRQHGGYAEGARDEPNRPYHEAAHWVPHPDYWGEDGGYGGPYDAGYPPGYGCPPYDDYDCAYPERRDAARGGHAQGRRRRSPDKRRGAGGRGGGNRHRRPE